MRSKRIPPSTRATAEGRWLPRMVTATGAGQVPELTSEEEIVAAATAGLVAISGPGGFF